MALRSVLLVSGAIPALWIAINAFKAFSIDDPLFLMWAQTLLPRPGETPVEMINWISFDQPLAHEIAHYPPGWALIVAAARRVAGDSEFWLHWLQWPFAAAFLAGAALIARSAGRSAGPVLLLCATSPLFLLPATSVMADLACTGPAVLAIGIWTATSGLGGAAAAVLLLVFSLQIKQTSLVLFPLLLWAPRAGPVSPYLRWGAVALALIGGGIYPPVATSGASPGGMIEHMLGAIAVARQQLFAAHFGYGLMVCAAAIVFPAAIAVASLAPRRPAPAVSPERAFLIGLVALIVLARLGLWQVIKRPGIHLSPVPPSMDAIWFYGAFIILIAWAVNSVPALWRGPARWLLPWIPLNFLGVFIAGPFPAARYFTMSLPVVAILLDQDASASLSRRAYRWVLIAAAAGNLLVSSLLALNDAAFAGFCRDAAARGAELARRLDRPLVTTGQWGLGQYVRAQGGTVLGSARERLPEGAVVLAPKITDHRPFLGSLRRRARKLAAWEAPGPWGMPLFPARTLLPPDRASSFHGGFYWLPYGFYDSPHEIITVYLVEPLGMKTKR